MGASIAKTTVDILTESVVDVVSEIGISNNQSVGGDLNIINSVVKKSAITQKLIGFQQGLATAEIDMNMVDKILNNAKQKADAESVPLGVAYSESYSKISNIFKRSFNNSFKTSCSQSVSGDLNIINSVIDEATIEKISKGVQKCVSGYVSDMEGLSDTAAKIDQSAESKQTLFNVGIAGGVVIVVIFIIIAWYVMGSKSKSKPDPKTGGIPLGLIKNLIF
jgi:hypothetical protein